MENNTFPTPPIFNGNGINSLDSSQQPFPTPPAFQSQPSAMQNPTQTFAPAQQSIPTQNVETPTQVLTQNGGTPNNFAPQQGMIQQPTPVIPYNEYNAQVNSFNPPLNAQPVNGFQNGNINNFGNNFPNNNFSPQMMQSAQMQPINDVPKKKSVAVIIIIILILLLCCLIPIGGYFLFIKDGNIVGNAGSSTYTENGYTFQNYEGKKLYTEDGKTGIRFSSNNKATLYDDTGAYIKGKYKVLYDDDAMKYVDEELPQLGLTLSEQKQTYEANPGEHYVVLIFEDNEFYDENDDFQQNLDDVYFVGAIRSSDLSDYDTCYDILNVNAVEYVVLYGK